MSNRGRNLFCSRPGFSPHFSSDFSSFLLEQKSSSDYLSHKSELLDFTTKQAIKLMLGTNQYLNIREQNKKDLHNLYSHSFDRIFSKGVALADVEREHYRELCNWISGVFPGIQELNPANNVYAAKAVCSEYSPELQLKILGLNIGEIIEPVLDIGCGENACLVEHMVAHSLDAYGIDILVNSRFATSANWMDFVFTPNTYGTIVAHLSFSNHFLHHHKNVKGNFKEYAAKYMEILNSLKSGGSFHYAPALPFIEKYLPANRFFVQYIHRENAVSSVVLKLQ